MVWAVVSLLFGMLGFVGLIPVVLPVIGLALGANGYLKERKKEAQQKRVKVTALIGMICCGLVVFLFLLRGFVA